MSDDVTAVHVTDDLEAGERLRERFERQVPGVPLVIVESPFRSLVRPLVRFLEDAAEQHGDDVVVVLLPEYVPRHWWERFLYNENGRLIRRSLLGRPNILVAEVPFRRDVLAPASAAADDPARVAADPQELGEVAPRPDVAGLAGDRSSGSAPSRSGSRARCSGRSSRPRTRSQTRRSRAARHQPPADEPVARLVVRHAPPDGGGEDPATERVRQPADRRHRAEVAPSDDQLRPRRREGGEERRDLGRVVLAVGIEGDDRLGAGSRACRKPPAVPRPCPRSGPGA